MTYLVRNCAHIRLYADFSMKGMIKSVYGQVHCSFAQGRTGQGVQGRDAFIWSVPGTEIGGHPQ